MDSCEHVLASVALIATRFRKPEPCMPAGHQSRTTSPEPRNGPADRAAGLPIDIGGGRARGRAALFIHRAVCRTRSWNGRIYQLTDSDVPAVATLCERLGGLPLAIELAATKLDQYSPVLLLESLDRRFSLLRKRRSSHAPPASYVVGDAGLELRVTVGRRGDDLSAGFSVLRVVHSGGRSRHGTGSGIRSVPDCCCAGWSGSQVAGGRGSRRDSLRYRMLDCARAYAAERLGQQPMACEAQGHFARFMLTILERFVQERADYPLTVSH